MDQTLRASIQTSTFYYYDSDGAYDNFSIIHNDGYCMRILREKKM